MRNPVRGGQKDKEKAGEGEKMSGGMEDCAKMRKEDETKQNTVSAYDREKAVDAMHKSYLEYSGRISMKRNHPSREVYGAILEHAQLWNIAVQELNKNGGEDAEQHHNSELLSNSSAQS